MPPGLAGRALVYRELERQASVLSFNDVFYLLAALIVLVAPLALLMKRPGPGNETGQVVE